MNRHLRAIALVIICAVATPAAAQPQYAPGTVGYLYEDCKEALTADHADIFANSYCFNFGVGYGFGTMGANTIIPPINKNDPCFADKSRLNDHLNGRYCQAALKPPPYALTNPVMATLHLFFGWIDYLHETDQTHLLNQPLPSTLNAMVTPGPFCDKIDEAIKTRQIEKFPYPISKPVQKFISNPLSIRKTVMARTTASTYEQCKADSQTPDNFRATNCGAEILGYLTGINSTNWIQKNRLTAEDKNCAPAMDRIYQSLDLPAYRCHTEQTDPMLLALRWQKKHRDHFESTSAATHRFSTISLTLSKQRLCSKF